MSVVEPQSLTGPDSDGALPQAARRNLVIEAAVALADAGGYDAVTMKAVADRSGVALATIYRWFASKDHLLAEALLMWIEQIGAEFSSIELPTTSPADRVAAVMNQVSDAVTEHPHLAAAAITALLSHDEAVLANFDHFHASVEQWIAVAIGDTPERDAIIEILEHLIWSSLIALVRGRDTPQSVRERLVLASRLLLA